MNKLSQDHVAYGSNADQLNITGSGKTGANADKATQTPRCKGNDRRGKKSRNLFSVREYDRRVRDRRSN